MNDILLLILGCAIQCEKKEEFIEHIKQLDVDVQRGLVLSIQEITENPDNVLPYRVNELGEISRDELLVLCENLYRHLQVAMEQRDDYIETIIDFVLLQDSEEYREKLCEESPKFRPRNSITQASFHSSNILAANKERITSLQSELDDQNVLMADMKEELEQMKMQLESMRLENKHLVNEAAWAKTYRDELDVLKAQLENTNKLRSENARLKAIAEDVDFYKKKYEESQDQTDVLYEQKLVLEEQAKDASGKIQRLNLLENENKKLCTQVNLLVEEQGEDQRRIRELVDEIAKLSVEKQESISACSVMNAELDGLKMQKEDDGLNVPLMVEYNQSADLLRLEKDNKHLQGIVDTMGVPDSRIKLLEDYNRNLAENIIYYKNLIGKLIKCLILAGDTNQEICDVTKREYNKMLAMLGNIKHSSQLDKVTTELQYLVNQLAKKGVVIDAATLKEALVAKSHQSNSDSEDSDETDGRSKLQESLEEKESRICELEESLSKLNELSQVNGEMKSDIAHKEEKIAYLEQSVEKLDALTRINEQLKDGIANKEREVAKLKKSMESMNDLTADTTRLKSQLLNKDESILHLKENLDKSNELITRMNVQLKTDVCENEQRVAQLRQSEETVNDVCARSKELEADIAIKDETIAYLKQSLDKHNNLSDMNDHLKEDLAIKDQRLADAKESLDKLSDLSQVNEHLKDVIMKKDQKLALLKETVNKVSELTELNNHLKNTLTIKDQKISHAENTVANLEESAKEELKLLIQSKEASLQEKEKEIKEKEKEISVLQQRLNDVNSELERKEETCKQLKKNAELELKKLSEKIPELQRSSSESGKLKSIVKDKDKQILMLHDSLNECQCKASQLETRIDELTSANSRSTSASQQKEERLTALKNQLEEYLSSNRTLTNELKMKDEKLKSVARSLEETMQRNNELEEDINMLEKDLEQLKQTGSLKNITNITEKIKLTKRARTELHIQRCPVKMRQKSSNFEMKNSQQLASASELTEYRELVEKLHEENQVMEKQTATMTDDIKKLSNENASLQMENETIMSTLDLLKLDYEAIQKEMDEAREHFQELDISATKIAHRCEVLVQLNATLEEENKAMMEQVNKLFAQNQDLLVSTLYNREQYIEDERAFSEHIYELEREKEKLSDQILAAEKALQSDGRKKGALWRGTHKILKRAGLAKRKDSNSLADTSLDIRDIERDSEIVPLTRENRMSLESISSIRSANRSSDSSPISTLNSLRPTVRNDDDNASLLSNSIRSVHRNGDDVASIASNTLLRPAERDGEDTTSLVSQSHRVSLRNGEDNLSGKPTNHSTPIQKVFVTQLTTPQVMKASPDGLKNLDYQACKSPNFIRKLPLNQSSEKNPLGVRKQSFSTSSSRSSPLPNDDVKTNATPTIDKESKLLDRSYTNFKEIVTDTMSLDSSDDAVTYKCPAARSEDFVRYDDGVSGSISPLGAHSFGSREQRSSFRRYEIEHMEPRPLPRNDFGSEEDILNNRPSKLVNKKKCENHSSEEQRNSLRKVMIGKNDAPAPKRDLNSNGKKIDQPWYEYGNV